MDCDLACPKCKTTLYRNPNMKLLVNVCGHNLCESCVELLFVKGSGACPECGIALRRNNFRLQLFEDANMDKEVDIRKRILRDFNKKEEDFDTLREYNDYLEMVEDIIFNLSNNLEVLETNKKIQDYKQKNQDFIQRNRHRQSKETLELADLLSEEARLGHLKKREIEKEEVQRKKLKAQNKEKLIDDLMFSEGDANQIVDDHKSRQLEEESYLERRRPKFSTGLGTGNTSVNQVEVMREGKPFIYKFEDLALNGPVPPSNTELISHKYINHVRDSEEYLKACGFQVTLPCMRALQEAMCDLFYSKN